jgi:hypothetical protein
MIPLLPNKKLFYGYRCVNMVENYIRMYVNGNMTHVHTIPKTKSVSIKTDDGGVEFKQNSSYRKF